MPNSFQTWALFAGKFLTQKIEIRGNWVSVDEQTVYTFQEIDSLLEAAGWLVLEYAFPTSQLADKAIQENPEWKDQVNAKGVWFRGSKFVLTPNHVHGCRAISLASLKLDGQE